jgi:hypothetical protein
MNGLKRFIARLVKASAAFNTLALPPPVPVFFQRSPGFPSGDVRGIDGLDFEVAVAGTTIQTGRTGADGKIDVRVPLAGTSTLRLMVNGAAVATYEVSRAAGALAAATAVDGQKQRLRLLGYQIGHAGPDGNGVDTAQNVEFERSVLDFQADNGAFTDAIVDAAMQGQLTTQAGA